jgi:hypothetical protein
MVLGRLEVADAGVTLTVFAASWDNNTTRGRESITFGTSSSLTGQLPPP